MNLYLRKWHIAIKSIPQSKILSPGGASFVSGFGVEMENNFTAWRGGKILAAVAAKVLSDSPRQYSERSASGLIEIAFSGSFYKSNLDAILPDLYESMIDLSDDGISNIIEAAVCILFQENESAVEDLARWLMQKAEFDLDADSVERLQRLGGIVIGRPRIMTGPPRIIADASLDGYSITGWGVSNKQARQNAADELFLLRSKLESKSVEDLCS